MSVASRIQSIENHIGDVYDTLELGGLDTTNIDKNLINISPNLKQKYIDYMNNGTEEIWNNWDKVTGSGTEITLDNTEEAPMKLELKGNTSQDTYTGKNLAELTSYQLTNSFTYSSFEKNNISVSKTAEGGKFYASYILHIPSAGTYSFIGNTSNSGNYNNLWYIYSDALWGTLVKQMSFSTGAISYSYTFAEAGDYILGLYSDKAIGTTHQVKDLMCIASGSSGSPYEPYTGGIPAPNPSYPQDVRVVKGDNVIKIEGKNLFNYNDITTSAYFTNNYNGTFTRNSNGSNIIINTNEASVPFDKFSLKAGSYSVSFDILTTSDTSFNQLFLCTTQNGTNTNLAKNVGTSIPANTLTHIKAENYVINNDAEKVGIVGYLTSSTGITISNIQVEKSITATSYEAYTSEEHTISLGVENLLDLVVYSATNNGVSQFFNNNHVEIKGKPTQSWNLMLSGTNITLQAGTYTLSGCPSGGGWNNWGVLLIDTNDSSISYADYGSTKTFTLTESHTFKAWFRIGSNLVNTDIDFDFNIQLEKGNVAHSYTEYGKAVQLCKINTYQDKIIGNDGSNLFDASTFSTFTSNVQYVLVNLKPNTEYTMTTNLPEWTGVGANLFIMKTGEDASSSTNGVRPNQSRTLTTDSTGVVKIGYRDGDNSLSDEKTKYWYMLNKGSTALEYQPYGTGEWYKKENIHEKVFDGTENWYKTNDTSASVFALSQAVNTSSYGNVGKGFSNYFKYAWSNTDGKFYFSTQTTLALCMSTTYTLESFKTWLSTHNTNVYYILYTPNYIKITNNTLIKQLDAIKKSKNSQTNISQENDGLPFELDVSALESLN